MRSLAFDALHLLLPLLALLAQSAVAVPSSCDATGGDMLMTEVFVDAYSTASVSVVLATSDGGAAFAGSRGDTCYPRLVKVDTAAKFEWFSECGLDKVQIAEDVAISGFHYGKTLVEDNSDSANPYLYLGGTYYWAGNTTVGFVTKYNMKTGACVLSRRVSMDDHNTSLSTLLVDSDGALVFGGSFYETDESGTTYSPWIGTLDKTTLEITHSQTLSPPEAGTASIRSIIEDSGYYIIKASYGTNYYLWVTSVYKSDWSKQWEWYTPTVSGHTISHSFLALGSGSYAVLHGSKFYTVTADAGIVAGESFPYASSMSLSPYSDRVILLGNMVNYSFAYYYNYTTDCIYDQGETAGYRKVRFLSSSKHPNYDAVWVTGSVRLDRHNYVAKITGVTPINCDTGYTNYMNKGCYAPVSDGCFGLCETCLIANDPDACSSIKYGASNYSVSLFAGRCQASGYHYYTSLAVPACSPIIQSSYCHPLCGGECLGVEDATRCAHHCVSATMEPYIDTSSLGNNVCKCLSTAKYSDTSSRCVLTTGCSPLCLNGECIKVGNGTKCISCVTGSNVVSNVSLSYTDCSCGNGTVMTSSGLCVLNVVCDTLCESCIDSNTCGKCPDISGTVLKDGKCVCDSASGYVLTSGIDHSTASCIKKSSTTTVVAQSSG